MPQEWFIKTKAGAQGPVDCKTLAQLAKSGKLKPNSPVSRDGLSWVKANSVPELSFSDSAAAIKDERWYVLTKHNVLGPFSDRKLQQLAAKGRLSPNVAVSRDREKWIKAKRVPGLEFPEPEHVEQQATAEDVETATATPTEIVRQQRLFSPKELAGCARFAPIQLKLFAGDSPPLARQLQSDGCESFPLFGWQDRLQQLSLFDPDADALASNVEVLPLRQQWLSLYGEEEWPTADRPPQLTLFAGIAPHWQPSKKVSTEADSSRPLFQWAWGDGQLKLLFPSERTDRSARDILSIHQLQFETLGFERFATAIGQLTLFTIEPQCVRPADSNGTPDSDGRPLLAWLTGNQQLRLFDNQPSSELENSATENSTTENSTTENSTTQNPAPEIESENKADAYYPPPEANAPELDERQPPKSDEVRWLRDQWKQVRKVAYVRRFGRCSHVAHSQAQGEPIEVYVFPASRSRPVTTLVTSGMSDGRMNVPDGRCSPRAELILYVDQPKAEYVNLLYFLAQLPFQQNYALRYGASFGHGNPPRGILPGSTLDGYVLMIPPVESDFKIHESTMIGDDPLQLLWVVPTTTAERAYLATRGMGEFCKLLDERGHNLTFDPLRRCYVEDTRTAAG